MSWLWSRRCAELQLRSPLCFLFLNELQADSFFLQDKILFLFFLSVIHPKNPVVQNQLHSRFIVFTLILHVTDILHVLHDLASYDVL